MLLKHGCYSLGLPEFTFWGDVQRSSRWLSSEHAPRVLDILLHLQVTRSCRFSNSYTRPPQALTKILQRLLSDTGRSFSFDNRGTGFGRGEGCGMIVLKPLDQAIRDNDSIRAVIAGTGLNQDGKTPGITMPNGKAQGGSPLPVR